MLMQTKITLCSHHYFKWIHNKSKPYEGVLKCYIDPKGSIENIKHILPWCSHLSALSHCLMDTHLSLSLSIVIHCLTKSYT